ncbi:YihY/virulence factor BrkB family protein [Solibacillus sp. FSL H8-0538]|uniref:YihY/virulence factor BrkB family protein n=1 Tax=Solibacillus sp. FSL H8-0538 TaxID=2921400 RepID=UPI0030F5458B
MTSDKKGSPKAVLALINSFIAPNPTKVDVTTAKGFVQDLFIRIKDVNISGMGAQLAFFFLLSFFPLLIFMVSLLPYLNLEQGQVFDFIDEIMPAEVYILIEGTLSEVLTTHNGGLLSVGILGTIWSASKGIDALMKGLNRAYDVEGRAGILNRAWSLIFTISLVLVFLIALVFPVFGHQIGNLMFSYIGVEHTFETVWTFVRWITPPALIFILLLLMYWIVPNTDPRLSFLSVLPGVIFATGGWLMLTYGFSFYINNFGNFSATYGSIGGVIILMLWLYFTGMILMFGGLINASMQRCQLAKKIKKEQKSLAL